MFYLICLAMLIKGVADFVTGRATQRRFDAQARRLARLEHAAGFGPEFPYEVQCPTCKAEAGESCKGQGFIHAHASRWNASPAANAARKA